MALGFSKNELRKRYDVSLFSEDPWHTSCGEHTRKILSSELGDPARRPNLLLNAGCGVYSLGLPGWREISVDLFEAPLGERKDAVCANIEALPFASGSFGAVICVGEVLGYCDPRRAIREFGRVAAPDATLICDFGSTLSARYLFSRTYGTAADIVADEYNRTEERVWVYRPEYIGTLLRDAGFQVTREFGTHGLPALACRLGVSQPASASLFRKWTWLPELRAISDVRTMVGVRRAV